MNILSIEFFVVLLSLVGLYYVIPSKYKVSFILLANVCLLFFTDKTSLIILIALSLLTFSIARYSKNKKAWGGGVICSTIGLIVCVFVYIKVIPILVWNELVNSENYIISIAGFSFWSLQMISYLVDVYNRKIKAEENYLHYLDYTSFFGYFVSGPIERAGNIIPQLKRINVNLKDIQHGMQIFVWGVGLKLILGQRMAMICDTVYNNYIEYAGIEILVAVIAYSIQIYCDFYGYSCMAVGMGEMFGLKIIQNFDSPYLSRSIAEFWRRWHISLSSWLKDYIYIPLGGNRKGTFRKYINLLIVFLISGIWHGVGTNFIIWGGMHAAFQIVGNTTQNLRNRLYSKFKINVNTFSHSIFKIVITNALVSFAWIFFRAPNLKAAFDIIKRMIVGFNPAVSFGKLKYVRMGWHFGIGENLIIKKDFLELCQLTNIDVYIIIISLIVVVMVDYLHYRKISIRNWIDQQNYPFRWCVYLVAIVLIYVFGIYGSGYNAADFIYSNF